jgi:hypothetical protein
MELLTQFDMDEFAYLTVAKYGGWDVKIVETRRDFQVLLQPEKGNRFDTDFSWSYHNGVDALQALKDWDPETEGEPRGFIRAIHEVPREPGECRTGEVL